MQLEHSFTVPVGIDDAWRVLLDIEKIAPCLPGAAIDSVDGDNFTGTVKVKLGPIGLTYKGKASFIEKDEAAHRTVIDARGRDARGNGTANAKVTATLTASGGATRVDVLTDLDITGKPAQFGRGVMVDVGNKLIGQFADCLAGRLTDGALLETPATSVPESLNPTQLETAVSDETPSTPKPRPRPRPRKAAAETTSEANQTSAKAAPAAKAGPAKPATAKPSAAKSTPTKVAASKSAAPDKSPAAAPPAAADAASASATRAATTASVPEPDASVPAEASAQRAAPDKVAPVTQLPTRDTAQARRTADEVEPINLIESAGPALAKRLAPVLALLVLLIVIARRARR